MLGSTIITLLYRLLTRERKTRFCSHRGSRQSSSSNAHTGIRATVHTTLLRSWPRSEHQSDALTCLEGKQTPRSAENTVQTGERKARIEPQRQFCELCPLSRGCLHATIIHQSIINARLSESFSLITTSFGPSSHHLIFASCVEPLAQNLHPVDLDRT